MSSREIVVPGELIDESGEFKSGQNTYKEGQGIYALRLGLRRESRGYLDIIPLTGKRYDPQRGDLIIGTVAEVRPTNWYLLINGHGDVGMHASEVPWNVDFGETADYLNVGDSVILKVYDVDDMNEPQVTMKDRACRKLKGGVTIQVQPSKVPRMIGRNGSMIETIQDKTNCEIFIGKNGIIWIDGESDQVTKAIEAFRKIEREAHTSGLTERIADFLKE